jgi:hypothetical protein
MPGGYVIRDADGQALVYVYCRDNEADAMAAKILTEDEARRVAVNIARLPDLPRHRDWAVRPWPPAADTKRSDVLEWLRARTVQRERIGHAGHVGETRPPPVGHARR